MTMGESFSWRNVKIDIGNTSAHHFQNIPTDCIEELELFHWFPTSNKLSPQSRSACYEWLELRQFPNLRSLRFNLDLLRFDIPETALSTLVQHVQDFRLVESDSNLFLNLSTPTITYNYDEPEGRTIIAKNLEMIGRLPWKLRNIEFCKHNKRMLLPPSSAEILSGILISNAGTLESIRVRDLQFGQLHLGQGLRTRFLRLRSIYFIVKPNDDEVETLAEFLRLQSQLESIHIHMYNLRGYNRNMTPILMDALRSHASPKLHTLRLIGDAWKWLLVLPIQHAGFAGLRDFIQYRSRNPAFPIPRKSRMANC